MRPSSAIVTIHRAAFLLFACGALFASPLFAEAVASVAQKNDTNDQQCDDNNKEDEKDILCLYSPLEKRCIEKRQEKISVPSPATTLGTGDNNTLVLPEQEEPQEKPRSIPTPLPKSVPVRRPAVINAPAPYIYKTENGRKVCGTKNDHPKKSDKGKGRHMDMECCLDPDEYPNPHCYYPPEKYEKFLKKKH